MVPNQTSAGHVSAWASLFNLGNSAVGAGILSFPKAFQGTGLLGGLLLCPMLAACTLTPLIILAFKASKYGASSYQGLVGSALGSAASNAVAWIIFVYIFGCCSAFLIIIQSSFHSILQFFLPAATSTGVPMFLYDRWFSVAVPAMVVVLPLSLLPNMGALAPTSALAVTAYSFTICCIVGQLLVSLVCKDADTPVIPPEVKLFNWDAAALRAIPIIVFAYQCHVQSVPIFWEMKPKPRLLPGCTQEDGTDGNASPEQESSASSPARKARGMAWVCLTTFFGITLLYLATGSAGYILFPANTKSNILNNFRAGDTLMSVNRALVGLAVSLHYPVDLHAARTALCDLIVNTSGGPHQYRSLALASLFIWAGSLTVACLVSDLGIVYQVVGGLAGSCLIFVLPGLLLARDKEGLAAGAEYAILPIEAEVAFVTDDEERLLDDKGIEEVNEHGGDEGTLLGSRDADIVSQGQVLEHPQVRAVLGVFVGWVLVATGVGIMLMTLYFTLSSAT